MFRYLDWTWRWLGTAISFALFGLGGLLLTLAVFPVLRLIPGDVMTRQRRARLTIHRSFRFYIEFMRYIGVLDYEVLDAERLRDARLIMANHPSLIDVVFLIALIPNANCVVKGKLLRNLFTRGPVTQAGYILNEAADEVLEAAGDAFSNGDALIVFPEGTRTTPGQALSLKRGGANIAVRSVVNITPVIIECSPTTLTKQDRWYHVPPRRVRFRITIRPEISIRPFTVNISPIRGARLLTDHLSQYFTEELALDEQPAA